MFDNENDFTRGGELAFSRLPVNFVLRDAESLALNAGAELFSSYGHELAPYKSVLTPSKRRKSGGCLSTERHRHM